MPQELYMNRLNMSFGINFKFNGYYITILKGYG